MLDVLSENYLWKHEALNNVVFPKELFFCLPDASGALAIQEHLNSSSSPQIHWSIHSAVVKLVCRSVNERVQLLVHHYRYRTIVCDSSSAWECTGVLTLSCVFGSRQHLHLHDLISQSGKERRPLPLLLNLNFSCLFVMVLILPSVFPFLSFLWYLKHTIIIIKLNNYSHLSTFLRFTPKCGLQITLAI